MLKKAVEIIRREGFRVFKAAEYREGEYRTEALLPMSMGKNIFSLSKSFTATAVGILCTKGQLDLDDRMETYLGKYFPSGADEKLADVRIRHLLTHTMGHGAGYMFEDDRHTHGTDDWLDFILTRPLQYAPGEKMVYTNSVFYLCSRIVEEITGEKMLDFLREELLRPLGFTRYAAGTCPFGHTFGASEMYFTCEDIVKLGVLYLNGGVYGGRRILSPEYVSEAQRIQTSDGTRSYGLGFWRNDARAYYGDGAYGQLILIVPAQKAVFAMQSYEDKIDMRAFVNELLDSERR